MFARNTMHKRLDGWAKFEIKNGLLTRANTISTKGREARSNERA